MSGVVFLWMVYFITTFAYNVQPETNTAMNFGLYSFDRGNPLIGHDVFWKMQDLLTIYRRIEWRVVDGNPAMKNYDRFCWKHGGNKVTLHKCMKDCHGIFHDEHIYEIVKENELSLNRR